MNKTQKIILFVCGFLIVVMGLFPPDKNYDPHRMVGETIFSPFTFFLAHDISIDFPKLLLEWLLVIVVGLFLVYFFRTAKNCSGNKHLRLTNKKVLDEPRDNQIKDISPFTAMLGLGEDCDQLTNAYGEFGYELTNPIPVNGPVGETVYINRLRSKTGVGFMYHRLGNTETPINSKPIDVFELVSIDATQRFRLYFDSYHPRRSTKCPDNLSLLSWSSLDKKERAFCKMNGFGITSGSVANFPYSLPMHVERNPELSQISPGVGKSLAKRLESVIREHNGKWERL